MTDTPPPVTPPPPAAFPPPAPISNEPLPPPPAVPAAPQRAASRGDKLRIILILGGIGAFLAVVLFLTKDNQLADDLTAGICFDVPTEESITTVTRRDCAAPHDAEVFHVAENTTATAFPISLSLDSFIDEACVPVFATYVGETYADSVDYEIGYFYPDRDAWAAGDRTFTCYIVRADEAKLTQSVKVAGT